MKKWISLTGLLIALATSLIAKPPIHLIDVGCNVENGFNYFGVGRDSYSDVPIGYIEKLTINGKEIDADFKVNDPKNPSSKRAVVAVLDYMDWKGGPDDSISLSGRFSPNGKAAMLEALCSSEQPKIAAEWIVFDYDHQLQQYFPLFHSNGKPIQLTLGDKYSFRAAANPNRENKLPINYQIAFNLTPPKGQAEQSIAIAFRGEGKTFSLPLISSYDKEEGQ